MSYQNEFCTKNDFVQKTDFVQKKVFVQKTGFVQFCFGTRSAFSTKFVLVRNPLWYEIRFMNEIFFGTKFVLVLNRSNSFFLWFLIYKKILGLLVEVFTDHEITLDQIISFDQSRELFRDFMSKEKSLGTKKNHLHFFILSLNSRGAGFLSKRKRVREFFSRVAEKRARRAAEKDLQAARRDRLFRQCKAAGRSCAEKSLRDFVQASSSPGSRILELTINLFRRWQHFKQFISLFFCARHSFSIFWMESWSKQGWILIPRRRKKQSKAILAQSKLHSKLASATGLPKNRLRDRLRDRFSAQNLNRLLDRVFKCTNFRQNCRTGFLNRRQDLRQVFKQDRVLPRQPVLLKNWHRSCSLLKTLFCFPVRSSAP